MRARGINERDRARLLQDRLDEFYRVAFARGVAVDLADLFRSPTSHARADVVAASVGRVATPTAPRPASAFAAVDEDTIVRLNLS